MPAVGTQATPCDEMEVWGEGVQRALRAVWRWCCVLMVLAASYRGVGWKLEGGVSKCPARNICAHLRYGAAVVDSEGA